MPVAPSSRRSAFPRTAGRAVAACVAAAVAACAGLAALALPGCSDVAAERDVRATVLDEAGRPIPGALFWADSRDDSGPIGWLLAVAGQAGEVPDSAREPLKIAWRPGARLTLAAFAPGRRPAILTGDGGRLVADGAVLTLSPADPSRPPPPLDSIAFPLEASPALAARARASRAWPALAAAFREAVAAREAAGETLSPAERRKAAFLEEAAPGAPAPDAPAPESTAAPGHSGRFSQ